MEATADREELLALSDLFLCLSRAFMPPPRGMSFSDWATPLAEDLEELGAVLGLETSAITQALRGEDSDATGNNDVDGWLVAYAQLFLTPPVQVPLNTGLYLEGSLAGNSAQMMQSCYERGGLSPDAGFRDLPDHVAMQLEFIGRLYERAAHGDAEAAALGGEFCANFILSWTDPLLRACESVSDRFPSARIFAALVGVMQLGCQRCDTD